MNNIFGKFKVFFYLFGQADGALEGVKLGCALGRGLLFLPLFKDARRECEVRFKRFRLKWRIGKGELTPYREIEKAFSGGIFLHDESKGWTVIDCGANIGLFSLFLKDAKFVIAVEANKEACGRAGYNFKKNGINGCVISKAVSCGPSSIKMKIADNSTVLSKVDSAGETTVEATTIDRIIDEHGLGRVDLLKLDLEGHEIEALKGADISLRRGAIDRIYLEFNTEESLEALDRFLIPLNYDRVATIDYNALYKLRPKGRFPCSQS